MTLSAIMRCASRPLRRRRRQEATGQPGDRGEDRIHAVDAERLQVCKRPPHEWMGEGVRGEDTEEEREGEINDIIRWNN